MTSARIDAYELWENRAACGDADPNLFVPIQRGESAEPPPLRVVQALAYCQACPVVRECGERRAKNGDQGVWGGDWWSDSKAPTGYSNRLLAGRRPDVA